MSYGICRVEKVKATAVGAMQYHNDRMPGKHSNPDIQPEWTHLNYELRPHDDYAGEVADRIERFRKSERKVRKDAVVMVEGVVTASPDWFDSRTPDEIRAFFDDAFEFVKGYMGDENVVHFTVHLDETTPHAHWGATPIKGGSLAWKQFFAGRDGLRAFQDAFYEQVSRKWGLERGERGTGRTHRDLQEMKRDAQREVNAIAAAVDEGRGELGRVADEVEAKRGELRELDERVRSAQAEVDASARRRGEALAAEREAAERLESVRRAADEVESIEAAGVFELAKLAKGGEDGARERAAEGENQQLRSRLAALEGERGGLGARERAARSRACELDEGMREAGRRRDGLAGNLRGLRERAEHLWSQLVDAAEHFIGCVFEEVGGLKWVFDGLGIESREGRGYDMPDPGIAPPRRSEPQQQRSHHRRR